MNYDIVAALVVRLFGALSFYWAFDDFIYCLAKSGTDSTWHNWHFYFSMMSARAFIGILAIRFAVPLGKLIAKNLIPSEEKTLTGESL